MRKYLIQVLKKAIGISTEMDDSNEPMPYRWALLGVIIFGVFALFFLYAAGIEIWIGVVFLLMYFTLALSITRVRAELGTPHEISAGDHYANPLYIMSYVIGTAHIQPSSQTGLSMLHWFNRGYLTFDDFLASLRSSRRKNLKRERRRVAEQGVTMQRKIGADISDEEWRGFYRCYMNTYQKRSGHDGYLNREFFDQLRATMASKLMLVVARHDNEIVACSLFLFDHRRLYGRYWGALRDVSCLHFEACFYQGIEFCIESGLQEFDPGTQGEHKLMRGFEPVKSVSYHWIADSQFRAAIADFLQLEKRGTDNYQQQAKSFLPYRKNINED